MMNMSAVAKPDRGGRNQHLTFKVDEGVETDIFTDVLVSVIDPRLQTSREISLIWLSAVLGSGVGLLASGLFAALREILKRP